MARNGTSSYSIRDRSADGPPEKKQRFQTSSSSSSSSASPSTSAGVPSKQDAPTPQSLNNASSVIYLGNVPVDWNEQIIGSVVAGSGKIVDIRSRLDPSGKSKNFCFIEYSDPYEAGKALRLLSQVTLGPKRKFRVELSKEGLRTSTSLNRPVLNLDRSFLPYYVQLPDEMKTEEERLASNNNNNINMGVPSSASSTATPNPSVIKQEINPIPEVLAKASTYLPKFNQETFKINDKIDENLQSIPPAHLIELISTLKTLMSSNNIQSAQQAFNMGPNIPINVVQAMVLMGLVDIGVIKAALQHSVPTPAPAPPVAPAAPMPIYQQHQAQQQQPDPRWPHLPYHTGVKLAALNPGEAAMISQVLSLSLSDINNLPMEQRIVVENIRSQYL